MFAFELSVDRESEEYQDAGIRKRKIQVEKRRHAVQAQVTYAKALIAPELMEGGYRGPPAGKSRSTGMVEPRIPQ